MNRQGPVVVNRGGAFSALIYSVFGLAIVIVVCATGLTVYSVNVIDRKVGSIFNLGGDVLGALPELAESLPPAAADLLDDGRDPSYREQLDVNVRLQPPDEHYTEWSRVHLDVTNRGTKIVTMLPVRIVLLDEDNAPVRAVSTYVATPLMIENEWRGPLLPGNTRHCTLRVYTSETDLHPQVELTDLRVWRDDTDSPAHNG